MHECEVFLFSGVTYSSAISRKYVRISRLVSSRCGGDTASTWVLKHWEHAGEYEDLVKNMHFIVANNDYALAA